MKNLVTWFTDNVESLPRTPFTLVNEEQFSLTWIAPEKCYQELIDEIHEGPRSGHAQNGDLENILRLLHDKFHRG